MTNINKLKLSWSWFLNWRKQKGHNYFFLKSFTIVLVWSLVFFISDIDEMVDPVFFRGGGKLSTICLKMTTNRSRGFLLFPSLFPKYPNVHTYLVIYYPVQKQAHLPTTLPYWEVPLELRPILHSLNCATKSYRELVKYFETAFQ